MNQGYPYNLQEISDTVYERTRDHLDPDAQDALIDEIMSALALAFDEGVVIGFFKTHPTNPYRKDG